MKQILISDKIYLIACKTKPGSEPQDDCSLIGEFSAYIPIEKTG